MTLFTLVGRELWFRKSQLVSGLLAVTLGIAVIVAIRSIAVVSEKAVAVKLDKLGANILVLPQGGKIDDYYAADIDAPTFSESLVSRIVSSTLPGIDNMSPKLSRRVAIEKKNIVLTGILPKSEIASKPLWQQAGLRGKALTASCAAPKKSSQSAAGSSPKSDRKTIDSLGNDQCLLGATAATSLNKKQGDNILIAGNRFSVGKVLVQTGTIDDDRVFVNLHAAQQLLGVGSQINAIEIMGCCNEISDGLLKKLQGVLPEARVTTIGQIVSTQIETNAMMRKLMYAFLVIIVLVGSLSIGNFIWANVNERRKEIGTLRLIGYDRKHIYFVMLTKAVILGVAGGILGYGIGTAAAAWLGPIIIGISVAPIISLLPISLMLAVAIAVFGAIIPTWRAGKIEPYANIQDA